MAILNEELIESDQGFQKKIDENSVGLLMDMAQKGQYSKPIESTIREIASNAVDSHRERDIAISILTGVKQVSDFFVEKEGSIYEASKFNPNYYDLNWLSDKKNILIEYFKRDNEERDLLRITDYGVGLGGNRLEGYMMLSYSTKRLNRNALGKFGIGGKAPLSTGVDSFIMKSNYNGEHYEFEIFLRKIDSLIPRYNPITEEENTAHYFSSDSNNYQYYSIPTIEKNSVSIEVEVKKHQRDAYKQAVINQLLYFSNVDFKIYHNYQVVINEEESREEYSYIENVPVTTQIYYESPNFLISKNNLYTRPHVVIGQPGAMVNYGLIDFSELELAPRTGNVGIIIDSSEVDITPSRENVIWSTTTRETILRKFDLALKEANEVVNKELEDPDILKWLEKSISLLSDNGSNQVVRQLSGLIDKTQIVSTYSLDSTIKYEAVDRLLGFQNKLRSINRTTRYQNGGHRYIIERKELTSFKDINFDYVYFTSGEADKKKDAFIQSSLEGSFYLITIPTLDDKWWAEEEYHLYLNKRDIKHYTKEEMNLPAFENGELFKDAAAGYFLPDSEIWALTNFEIERLKASYNKGVKFLEFAKQSEYYHDYDEVVVPDDWKPNLYEDKSDAIELGSQTGLPTTAFQLSEAKRRKQENKVFFKYANFYRKDNRYYEEIDFGWKQKEELADILNGFQGTLVYATQPDKEELAKFEEEPTPQELAGHHGIDSKIYGNKIIKNTNNIDTDENLLKVVAGLLIGDHSNVKAKSNEDDNWIENNKDNFFLKTQSNYGLFPNVVKSDRASDYNTPDLALIKVAKPLAKKLSDFIPVREFVLSYDESTNSVKTHAKLMNWYTAKRIAPLIYSIPFLHNFQEISSYHAKEYKELYDLVKKYAIDISTINNLENYPKDLHKKLVKDFDELADFQLFVKEGHTDEEILEYSKEKLAKSLSDATIIDIEIYNRVIKLVEWATPIKDLLNNIPYFIKGKANYNSILPSSHGSKDDFLDVTRNYLRYKSVEIIELAIPVVSDNSEEKEDYDEDDEVDYEE